MKGKTLLFVLTFLLPALLFLSCTKIDTPPDTAVLTSKWFWHAWATDDNGNKVIEPDEVIDEQRYYRSLTFNTDGTGLYHDDLTDVSFTWGLQGDLLLLNFPVAIPDLAPKSYHLDSLTTHSFVISDTNIAGAYEWRSFRR